MTHFSDLAGHLGFGRDKAGDAARREEQNVVELPDGSTVAGVPPEVLVTPELLAHVRRQEDRALRDALRVIPERADRTVPDDPEPVPGHRLEREQHGSATVVRCECGRWDGGWLGPRSRRRVLDDHAAHVAAELAAAGPLIVPSERADQPKEVE